MNAKRELTWQEARARLARATQLGDPRVIALRARDMKFVRIRDWLRREVPSGPPLTRTEIDELVRILRGRE